MTSTLRRYASFTAHEKPTVGDSKISYIGVDHLGWMICDGRTLNVSDFYLLWSVIGYSFGGSGTTFQLPAAAGRVPGVSGTGAGLTPRTTGDMVGTETHTLTIAEMPAHKHGSVDVTGSTNGDGFTTINGDHTHTHNAPGGYGNLGLVTANGTDTAVNVDNSANELTLWRNPDALVIDNAGDHQHEIRSTGGDQPHNNMQPTIFMGNMFIYSGIPTLGVWPYTAATKVK